MSNRREEKGADFDREHSFSDVEIRLFEDFLGYLREKKKGMIPVSVFRNNLGPLETVVKYLREELSYGYKEISVLLNRKEGTVGVSYRKAKKKFPSKLDVSSIDGIPLVVFKDGRRTVFEAIVVYLRDTVGLKFNRIAKMLNRNYRTVWTVYRRAKRK